MNNRLRRVLDRLWHEKSRLEIDYAWIISGYSTLDDKPKLTRTIKEYAETMLPLIDKFESLLQCVTQQEREEYARRFYRGIEYTTPEIKIYKAFFRNAAKTGYLPEFGLRQEFLERKGLRNLLNIGWGESLDKENIETKIKSSSYEQRIKCEYDVEMRDVFYGLNSRSMTKEEYITLIKKYGLDEFLVE